MHLLQLMYLAVGVSAVRQESPYQLKESHPLPNSFIRERDAPPSHLLRLQVVLHQPGFEELERHLAEVSDLSHGRYGHHLTKQEVDGLTRPNVDALQQVEEWLGGHVDIDAGAIQYNTAQDVLTVSIPVLQAERLLDTKFGVYRHHDGSRLVRTQEWKLPQHLHQYIATVQPTTSFIRNAPQVKGWYAGRPRDISVTNGHTTEASTSIRSVCNATAVTPLCLRTLYGTINYTPQVPGQNRLGLTNFRNQVNNRSDIGIFLEKYRPEAVSAAEDFGLISVDGGTLQQTPLNETQLRIGLGGEGNLDAEYLLSLAWPTPLTSWSVAGAPPFIPDADTQNYTEIEPYLAWLDYVLQQDDIPQVVSNSYADDEQEIPPAYAHAVCRKFAQLAARGVTVLTGSGDGGIGGTMPGGSCLSNKDNKTEQFNPQFPSTCPYVTSVGGTVNFDPEVAAFDARVNFSSGAGFSNYFRRPDWQADTVDAYLTTLGGAFDGLYNVSGRAYPDVAAYSVNYTIIWNGTELAVDGTSASTPTMAATISLVNDALLAAGKPVLGWLNPWLYKHGGSRAFADVVSGSASGCNTTGFPAGPGWDAVTGFGTPRFDRLLEAVGLEPSSCPGYSQAA